MSRNRRTSDYFLKKYKKDNNDPALIICVNTNTAKLKKRGRYKTFPVATGDIYGDCHDHPYYTPTGYCRVKYKEIVKYGKFMPCFICLSFYKLPNVKGPKDCTPYWLHGPYDDYKDVFDLDGKFKNNGYLSKGCIRFRENDLWEVYKTLKEGDLVQILDYKDPVINGYVKKHSKSSISAP